MSATLENSIKFGVVITVVALCSFWQNMEGYQKDRVATVIVRSAENLVNQSGEPQQLETPAAKEAPTPSG
ncbi:MAG: hypothetical protein AAFY07_07710 [Pseudomonadota bacterium]